MSIASRITSIEGHISDIYDSVELTGVDTTDIDKNLVNVPNTLKEGYIDIINNGTDTLYSNFPKVSGEGTNLSLNNTYQAPMRNNLKGNTSQTGTPTPTSPIDVNVVSGDNEIIVNNANFLKLNDIVQTTTHGITYSCKDGVITLNGTVDSGGFMVDFNTCWLPSGTYYFARNSSGTSTGSWQNYLRNSSSQLRQGYGDFTTTIGQDVFFRLYANPGVVYTNFVLKPSVTIGTTAPTTYEPYNGDTYNIDLPVENLLQIKTDLNVTQNNLQFKYENGAISITGTANATSDYYIPLQSNIVLDSNTYTFSCFCDGTIGSNVSSVRFVGAGGVSFGNTSKTLLSNSQVSITSNDVNNTEYKFCLFSYTNGTTYNIKLYFQLEKGSKANSYTPYGTTPIEMCKIGNYQDYIYKDNGSWYLHKEIEKVTYNGTENWTTFAINYEYQIILQNAKEGDYENQFFPSLCNKYVNHNVGGASLNNYEFSNFTSGVYRWIRIRHNDITTLANYKTWLASNTPTFYYLLATPTNTEITDTTLINQLEELYIAKSKENQTNISQINNDLGFIISASALKKG